ncbi:MAG: hypothetical protein WC205_18930 [Opitutaceae bacterium]|jgi:hypothetical protein
MKYLTISLLSLVCSSFTSTIASAATVTVSGLTTDAGVTANLQLDGGSSSTTFRAGLTTSSGFGRSGVWVFQLPNISASDVQSVSFSVGLVSLTNSGSINFNSDLYAITATASNSVLGSYYYNGSAADTTSGVSLIQDNFTTTSTSTGAVSTSLAGDSALTSFVVSQLNAGNGGKFIFLRISADTDTLTSVAAGYNFATADNITDGVTLPTLTITTTSIPEPSTYAIILGLVAVGAAVMQRSRSRGTRFR